jgi:methyl-accepting chemotaxis protein
MEEDATRRWTIRSRLVLGLLAIVVLMTADAWFIIRQQGIMDRSFCSLERMDMIERFLLECRRQEKNFLLRRDQASLDLFAASFDSLLSNTSALAERIKDPDMSASLVLLGGRILEYGDAFQHLRSRWFELSDPEERSRLDAETVATARACHALAGEVRNETISEFRAAHSATRTGNVLSVLLGLGLSIVVAALLTRNIVGPLEYLRKLAEKVSTGDIQDMDVEFSDLDMKRFTSRESFDLARTLRYMVSNLRMLVSTERGLMDDYHMTILVLANKALGRAGWSAVERARSAAGFRSFSDVHPSNVDRFLVALEKEAARTIPEERVRLLSQAIREHRS